MAEGPFSFGEKTRSFFGNILNRVKLNKLMEEVSAVVEPCGFVCVEAEWQGHDRVLRLFIDSLEPGSGMDLDGCVRVSRLLDESGLIDKEVAGNYTLEVSSPGVERPLRRLQDFTRFIGQEVEARLSSVSHDRRRGRGILTAVASQDNETNITIDTQDGVWTFPLSVLAKANVVHNWGEG